VYLRLRMVAVATFTNFFLLAMLLLGCLLVVDSGGIVSRRMSACYLGVLCVC